MGCARLSSVVGGPRATPDLTTSHRAVKPVKGQGPSPQPGSRRSRPSSTPGSLADPPPSSCWSKPPPTSKGGSPSYDSMARREAAIPRTSRWPSGPSAEKGRQRRWTRPPFIGAAILGGLAIGRGQLSRRLRRYRSWRRRSTWAHCRRPCSWPPMCTRTSITGAIAWTKVAATREPVSVGLGSARNRQWQWIPGSGMCSVSERLDVSPIRVGDRKPDVVEREVRPVR